MPMTPSELANISDNKHLKKAANIVKQVGSKPYSEKFVTIINLSGIRNKAWRLKWQITAEFKVAFSLFGGIKPTLNDVKHKRIYSVDVYSDNVIDYITHKE
jgi:hypothetical protein